MNDQNRLRIERIAAQHASRATPKPTAPEAPEGEDERAAAFLAAFARVRDEVLRPAMAEVGLQLKKVGYAFRISPGGDERSPSIDFHVILADRGASKDTVRFSARKDAVQGWLVIGELELTGSPVELTRFETTKEITHDVAEQLVVDAVEQMFAPAEAPRSRTPSPLPPAAIPAPAPASPSKPTTSDSMGLSGANLSRANPPKAVLAGARFDDAVMVDNIGVPPPEPEQSPAPAPEPASTNRPLSEPVVTAEQPTVLASKRSPLAATSLALDLPRGPALPFAKRADGTLPVPSTGIPSLNSPSDNPAPTPSPAPAPAPARSPLGATSLVLNLPISRALPFGQGASQPSAPARSPLAATSLALDVPKGPALPFGRGASQPSGPPLSSPPTRAQGLAAVPTPDSTPSTIAPSAESRADLRGTLDIEEFPHGPALPFAGAGRQPFDGSSVERGTPQADVRVAPTPSSKGALDDLRETSDIVHADRGPVLPFDAAPALNLEDYARFRARLAVRGEDDRETLRYYGVPSPLIKEALQEKFAARFRQDPEAQRCFVELVQRFVAELREEATKR